MVWKTLESKILLDVSPFLRVRQERIEIRPNEVINDFYQVDLRSFALVVAVLENGNLLMIDQYKHGPRRKVLNFPGGFLEANERPEVAARRELKEETGLEPATLYPLGSFIDNGNQRGCMGHYFLAIGCRQTAAPNPGDLEDFSYVEMTKSEVGEALEMGRIGVIHHVAGWGLAQTKLAELAAL